MNSCSLFAIDYSKWNLTENKDVQWTKFNWVNDNLQKSAIIVPCRIGETQNTVTFQLDTGADLTGIYENTYNSISKKSKSNFPKKLKFESFEIENENIFIFRNYGNKIENIKDTDTIHLGTLGADFLKNRILILDFPNSRLKVTNEIPSEYSNLNFLEIELDNKNRPIFSANIDNENLKLLYDTGTSAFPILIPNKKANKFFANPKLNDSVKANSWGTQYYIYKTTLQNKIKIMNTTYSNLDVYYNPTNLGTYKDADAILGNALYFEKIVIIDFKNKKVAIK